MPAVVNLVLHTVSLQYKQHTVSLSSGALKELFYGIAVSTAGALLVQSVPDEAKVAELRCATAVQEHIVTLQVAMFVVEGKRGRYA